MASFCDTITAASSADRPEFNGNSGNFACVHPYNKYGSKHFYDINSQNISIDGYGNKYFYDTYGNIHFLPPPFFTLGDKEVSGGPYNGTDNVDNIEPDYSDYDNFQGVFPEHIFDFYGNCLASLCASGKYIFFDSGSFIDFEGDSIPFYSWRSGTLY